MGMTLAEFWANVIIPYFGGFFCCAVLVANLHDRFCPHNHNNRKGEP